jgi:hypothetical protein
MSMPTSIFFNGRVISVPGSYSEVDASGLAAVGLGASGIVALLGTAEGGKPVSAITQTKDFLRFTKEDKVKAAFRSGDLREAGVALFSPSRDPDIQAGAQEVVCMKVNPATQATASFANTQGNALDLTSLDYGAFASQINVSIASGTIQGKLLTIRFEDQTESKDDLGGDNIFQLQYSGGTAGWGTAVAQVGAPGVTVNATRTVDGEDDAITTQLAAAGLVEVLSSSAGDVGQSVTIYGTNAANTAAQKETVTLNGVSVITTTLQFRRVLGVVITGTTTVGTVTVRAAPAGAAIITLGIGVMQKGAFKGEYMYVNNVVASLVANGATVKQVLIFGKNAAGADAQEIVVLNGAVPVATVGTYSQITAIVTGDVEAARTVTTSAVSALAAVATQNTVKKLADYFNAKQVVIAGPITRGYICTIVTPQTGFLIANLDYTVSPHVNIFDPATGSFRADLYAMIAWINQNSVLVSAAKATGASGGSPSNTSTPVFLAGGTEGTAQFSDYQAALNLLKQTRVNTIVPLTGDPAVHAAVEAHCAYMSGIGRSERDAVAGALNAGLTDVPTKAEYQAQVLDLNSRHMRLWGQAIERYNTAGEREEFLPTMGAVVVAGMQAGAPVGLPLTYKYMNILGFRQHSTWNPVDDAEEMIQAGCIFCENVEGVGRRIVRNITTYLIDDNLAYSEASVNQAVNYAVFNFRTEMEYAVGKRGFSGTLNAAKGIAISVLGLLVDGGILVATQGLDLDLVLDVLEVSVEIAPVLPINFVKTTVHLVTIRQTAA